jgi:phage antirepressor YoqD-like protein
MVKKIVSFALSDKSIAEIDKTAKALGMSRSQLIDFLAEKGFHFSDDVKAKLQKISEMQDQTEIKIEKERSRC